MESETEKPPMKTLGSNTMILNYLITMYKKNKFIFLSFVLCLNGIDAVLATEIKTTVDRNPVTVNELFQITFTATESPDDDPDFSPLKENFEILNQTQKSNSSWINGKSSKTIQWILNVMPKQTGKLLIPAISFGEDQSQTLSVLVTKTAVASAVNTNDDLFLEVGISSKKPYVQSQVIYTLRFYRKVDIAQARLTEPEMPDAIIEKLGEDNNYSTDINGVGYAVTERKYAIFPQKSGIETIKPLILTAEVISSRRPRFNGFFNRQTTKTKRVMSKAITLDVQKAPESFTGNHWLPAEHIHIEEKWSGDIANMKIGEPLTRTLTILGKGVTVAQLPELNKGGEDSQLKTYPDQPVLKEKKQADGLIAFREEKIAYIPSKSGSYSLPAIEIPWFNIQTQKMEIARIAGTTVTAISSQTTSASAMAVGETLGQIDLAEQVPVVQTIENKFWMWLSIGLALGWLISILFFIRKLKLKSQPTPTVNTKDIRLKETIKVLKKACIENNALAAKDALLDWGKIKFNSGNLSEIAVQSEARLRDEIYLLNKTLYSNLSEKWQGKKLFQTFTENNAREKVAKKTNDGLEPLYKL
jgi:hypothetical protein